MARMRKMSIVTTGVQKTGDVVTKEMLDSAVANFNKDARPPTIAGHIDEWSDQIPAYGRVDNPYVQESQAEPGEWELIIEVHYTPCLESMEDSGEFEGFSISLHPCEGREGWYIHHLAILGCLPPAANTKTLEVVELSALPEGKKAVQLSAVIIEESILDMKKEELETMVKELTTSAVKEAVTEALASSNSNPSDAANTNPAATAVDTEETKALKEQLAQVQETTKATRIDEVKALAQTKEMSEAELKPIIDTLEATDAVSLCDNSAAGIFASMKRIVEAKPAKSHLPSQALFTGLPQAPVNLSAGQQPKDVDLMSVAEDSGF